MSKGFCGATMQAPLKHRVRDAQSRTADQRSPPLCDRMRLMQLARFRRKRLIEAYFGPTPYVIPPRISCSTARSTVRRCFCRGWPRPTGLAIHLWTFETGTAASI